jgi:hypothetical protein
MSVTIDQITEFLDEQELSYGKHETAAVVMLGFSLEPKTTRYRDRDGDAHLGFLIRLLEDGHFVAVSIPWTWNLADCPHKAAVFEAALDFQARSKLIRFDYDPDDGELRANAEIAVEDSSFTSFQLHRLIQAVGNAVLELDPVVRHAMQTGAVDMNRLADSASPDGESNLLQGLADEAGGVETLERLACGDPLPDDEAAAAGEE